MARKKRAGRGTGPSARKKRKTPIESKQTQNRALIAILALLLILHLIDEKTFDGVTSTLKPRKRSKKHRKNRIQHRAARRKKT